MIDLLTHRFVTRALNLTVFVLFAKLRLSLLG